MIDGVFRVDGDSMRDIGLHDGMHVQVGSDFNARAGDVVVVRIDEKIFIKVYDIEDGRVVFRSRNREYPDIKEYREYQILGGLSGCFSDLINQSLILNITLPFLRPESTYW